MIRFLNSIGLNDVTSFDIDFDLIQRNPLDREQIDMYIVKDTPWEYQNLDLFMSCLSKIHYPYKMFFSYRKAPNVYDAIQLFEHWYTGIYHIPCQLELAANGENIEFVFHSEKEQKDNDLVITDFKDFLHFINYAFIFEIIVKETPKVVQLSTKKIEKIEKKASTIAEDVISQNDDVNDNSFDLDRDDEDSREEEHQQQLEALEKMRIEELQNNYKAMQEERKRRRSYKKGDYKPLKDLSEIFLASDSDQNVDFFGTVFECTTKDLSRSDGIIATIGVGDDTSAIYVKAISNNSTLTADKIKSVVVGCNIRVRGYPQHDRYTNELNCLAHFIDILPPNEKRKDNHPNKRVELHLHTKMSSFDGLSDMKEYCDTAKAMGHTAIAITDHAVVQGFPAAQQAAKKSGLKMIYGCELYMVDNVLKCAINPQPIRLSNANYVILDFETTGLSSRYDQILEFGAWRYEGGLLTKSMDLFIKPTIRINEKITNLTGITQKMVDKGLPIKEALAKIEEFCKDAILVTHNAEFDIGFLNEARKNNGLNPINNAVVDTLSLSRYLFPNAKNHRLGSLASNLDITSYNEDEAHRADFDAKVLAEIWLSILNILTKENHDLLHSDLANFEFSNELLKHYRTKHVVALAKDPQGLKDLYRLVSLSHIQYLADYPKVPRSLLIENRGHLLLGSACFNSEIFDIARTRSEPELISAIKFYDYIEIQPPENYSFLVNMGDMSKEEVQRTILDIISAAKKAGVMICITGDVHYAEPNEHIYRDVYIATKAIGKTMHPLNPYRRAKLPYFDNPHQHYRSTDEMFEAFPFLSEEEKEEYIVTNTNKIADMIEPLFPVKDHLYAPTIPHSAELLTESVYNKAHELYGDVLPEVIETRLKQELEGIIGNGYSVTYYIAAAIVKKANSDGYIVGSRGSVGSSLVATMAGITEVNPLPPHYRCPKCKHFELANIEGVSSGYDLPEKICPICGSKMVHDGQNIPFATFLGFHAEKVPDIDLNFPPDYQSIAHDYTKVLLGEKNVFRAGTIGTVKDKTAFGYVHHYYEERNIDLSTVSRAQIAKIASHCAGVKRTTGQHPGGIVVIPKGYDVLDFTPIQYPADKSDATWMTTHFEFDALHDTLLKLDLLGHDDPLMLRMLSQLTNVDIRTIPMNDVQVLSLFSTDKALNRKRNFLKVSNGAIGLPEFGTPFVRGMLDDTKPQTFGDLLILSGLSHGTNVWNDNAQTLIESKTCDLRHVIGCRDDIMTFLSSQGVPSNIAFVVMEDVRHGKKIKPEYLDILKANNIPQYYIDSCNKIKYLFPKAHATAYVMMAIRIAYFKVHYPLEYYATFFTVRSKAFDISSMIKGEASTIEKIEALKKKKANTDAHLIDSNDDKFSDKDSDVLETLYVAIELYERGFKFSNIDLYKSDSSKFVVDHENNAIIPPFITIDGLGEAAGDTVIEARKNHKFTSQEDLLRLTKLSTTNVKKLAELDALGGLGESDQMSLFEFDFKV